MTISPLTVLMAVRNGEPYLTAAIESILNQTYKDFHFLIIDDASEDHTRDVTKSYNDPRIELICLPRNVGQTTALNIGLRHVSSPWIARMDADDFSEPTRLQEQMKVIESDPSLCCVGTCAWIFREDPKIVDSFMMKPEHDIDIKKNMLREPSMIHGSLLINREALLDVGGYNEKYRVSADLDLYDRLLTSSRKARNIPKPLLGIRRHDKQETKALNAINEGIDIFQGRLLKETYSPADKKILRSALAFFYLLRVRYRIKKSQFGLGMVRDAGCAFWTSPYSFLRSIPEGIVDLRKGVTKNIGRVLRHEPQV